MGALSKAGASTLWIALLTGASTATTLVFACATPFPALAALAAVHMRMRDGIALVLIAWAASQVVGFGLRGYPHDPMTLAWGPGLATAAVGSVLGGYAALARLDGAPIWARLMAAYGAGFVAFKAVVLLWSFGLGGTDSVLNGAILARQLLRNGAILIGLLALYHGLLAIGLPPARGRIVAAA